MKTMKEREIKGIYALVTGVFLIFLLVPILLLLGKSFEYQGGIALSHYADVLTGKGFAGVFARSAAVASLSAVVTTVLAFILSYTIHYTNVPGGLKGFIRLAAVIPMLLPTITYGFAIIYSFGKQGLLTRLLGRQLFDIYGFWGLLLGYVISLRCDRCSSYKAYMSVQNELVAAYNELRDELAQEKWQKNYMELDQEQQDAIREIYSQKISEAEPKKYGEKK